MRIQILNNIILKKTTKKIIMKKVILFTSLLVFLSFNVSAQTKKDKIVQLFALMNTDKMMNSMVDNMSSMFTGQNQQLQNSKSDSIQRVYIAFVMKETKAFGKKLIDDDMVTVYDKCFTEQEIEKYINFYNTPEGKKLIEQTPTIQKDVMATVMTKYMPDLQTKFKNKLDELNKK